MNNDEKIALLKEIALLNEHAFRRGFHHGTITTASEHEAAAWRDGPIDNSDSPPGMPGNFYSSLLSRLECEVKGKAGLDTIQGMFRSIKA